MGVGKAIKNTPEKISLQLSRGDRYKRTYVYDLIQDAYVPHSRPKVDVVGVEYKTLSRALDLVWDQDSLARLVEETTAQIGKPTRDQVMSDYVLPLLRLQYLARDSVDRVHIVREAIKTTCDRGVHLDAVKHSDRWSRYARRIVESGVRRTVGTGSAPMLAQSPASERVDAILLAARSKNEAGENAKSLLKAAIALSAPLAAEAGWSQARAQVQIQWAFKIGEVDVLSAHENKAPIVDYMPDWDPRKMVGAGHD